MMHKIFYFIPISLSLWGMLLFLNACENTPFLDDTYDAQGGTDLSQNSDTTQNSAYGTVRGSVSFEYLNPSIDEFQQIVLTDVQQMPAVSLPLFVIDAQGQTIGQGIVSENGHFEIPLQAPLQGGESLYLTTLLSDNNQNLLFAVLRPDSGGEPADMMAPIWTWQKEIPADGDVGEIFISQEEGSGAVFIYLVNASAISRIYQDFCVDQNLPFHSLAVLWAPNLSWTCGSCYGQVPQTLPNTSLSLEQAIFVGGEASTASAWGYPVLLHEFGHYVAHNYSRDDSPGGTHYFGQPITPPFAWSEGWASFFSIATYSQWIQQAFPIFWDIQQNQSFWINYAKVQTSDGNIQTPDPYGSQTQDLDENYVVHMMWEIWDGSEVDNVGVEENIALSMDDIFQALGSSRILNNDQVDRGASGVDFVDILDALICQHRDLESALEEMIVNQCFFPYDSSPICY